MLRLLVSLFGRRPLVLALLAGYLAYVFTLSAGIWFAAGINQLPMQVALVFGLHAHVEYLRHRRIRSLVWAIAWTAGRAGLLREDAAAARRLRDRRLRLVLHRRHGAPAPAPLVALPRRRARLRRAGRRLPRALRPVRPGLLPRQRQHPAVEPDRLQPGRHHDAPGPGRRSAALAAAERRRVRRPDPGRRAGSRGSRSPRWWCTPSAPAPRAAGPGRCSPSPRSATSSCSRRRAPTWSAPTSPASTATRPRRRRCSSWPWGWPSCRCVGAPEQNEVREDGRAGEPAPGRGDHRRGRGGRAALERPVRRPLAGPEPVGAVLRERAQHARQRADKPVPLVDLGIPQTLLWSYRFPENAYSHVFRNLDHETTYPRSSVDRLYMFDDQGHLSPVGIPPPGDAAGRRRLRLPARGRDHDHPARRPGDRRWLVAADLLR